MFLSLIHYNIDHSNPLPLLFSVTFYSKSKKPGSHHPYLLTQFQCICMTVPELLPETLWEAALPTILQCLCIVTFAFRFTDY